MTLAESIPASSSFKGASRALAFSGLFQEVCGRLACGEMKGPPLETFPSIKYAMWTNAPEGQSSIHGAGAAKRQSVFMSTGRPSPAVTEVFFKQMKHNKTVVGWDHAPTARSTLDSFHSPASAPDLLHFSGLTLV